MERLTAQWGKNRAVPTKFDLDDFAMKLENPKWDGFTKILDRLAAYEDTGLSPDEIPQLKAQLEAALEDMAYIHCAGQKGCTICRNADQCGESDSHIGDCTGFEWRGLQPPKEEK